MTSRGARLLAGQVVIVFALLLVVYLTLLRPEGGKPLFAVGINSGAGQIAQGEGAGGGLATVGPGGRSGTGTGGGHRSGARASRHRGGPGGGAAGLGTSALSATGAQAATPGLGLPGRDGGEGEPTPTDDQYEDTVGWVFGRL